MKSRMKLALGYLWAIFVSAVFLAAIQTLSAGGFAVVGYVMALGYIILRWNLVAGKALTRNKWVSGLLRGFVLLCAFVIFAGVSSFHGGSEEGKVFAAVIALAMAIEAGRQASRLSVLPSGE